MIIKKSKTKNILLLVLALSVLIILDPRLFWAGDIGFGMKMVLGIIAAGCVIAMIFTAAQFIKPSYIKIEKDKITLSNLRNSKEFFFKDIKKIYLCRFEESQFLTIELNNPLQNADFAEKTNRTLFKGDIFISDQYEKSLTEIEKILKKYFEQFHNAA